MGKRAFYVNKSGRGVISKLLVIGLALVAGFTWGGVYGVAEAQNAYDANAVPVADPGGWTLNPENNHYYKEMNCGTWHQCEQMAMTQGAHLVTINDYDEQQWLVDTFGSYDWFWIGFTDEKAEGSWRWTSGEPVTFTNWVDGEPNNDCGDEDYALMNAFYPGEWADVGVCSQVWPLITKGIAEKLALYPARLHVAFDFKWNYKNTARSEKIAVIEGPPNLAGPDGMLSLDVPSISNDKTATYCNVGVRGTVTIDGFGSEYSKSPQYGNFSLKFNLCTAGMPGSGTVNFGSGPLQSPGVFVGTLRPAVGYVGGGYYRVEGDIIVKVKGR